jgi:hypothetical protein
MEGTRSQRGAPRLRSRGMGALLRLRNYYSSSHEETEDEEEKIRLVSDK